MTDYTDVIRKTEESVDRAIGHTPGPWVASRNQPPFDRRSWCISSKVTEECICNIPAGWNRQEANARLIAAAPEILEALEACKAIFANGHAIAAFNWGASALSAENICELNEVPGKIHSALKKAGVL